MEFLKKYGICCSFSTYWGGVFRGNRSLIIFIVFLLGLGRLHRFAVRCTD